MPAENYIYQRKAKHWGWKKVICLVEYGFPCSKLLWLGRNPSAVNLNFWAQQEEHVYGWYRLWYPYRPGINQFYQNTPLNVISFATYFGHTPTVFNSPRVILLASCKCCRLQPMFMGEIYYSWIESLRECYTAIQYTPCMEHLQYDQPKNSRVTLQKIKSGFLENPRFMDVFPAINMDVFPALNLHGFSGSSPTNVATNLRTTSRWAPCWLQRRT